MLSLGSVSILALLSFLLGKLWSSSEAVFVKRQVAYEEFLKRCPHTTEVHSGHLLEVNSKVIESVREAVAAVTLYASPQVERAVTEYMFLLGFILGMAREDVEEFRSRANQADSAYTAMLLAMKSDALGLTIFGIRNRLRLRPFLDDLNESGSKK